MTGGTPGAVIVLHPVQNGLGQRHKPAWNPIATEQVKISFIGSHANRAALPVGDGVARNGVGGRS